MYIDRNTAATRERTYERPDPVSLTEQAGYIPPQDQIESMILAGQRLNEARASQYDFASEDEIDEDAYDPTRTGNFDMADASQQAYDAYQRLHTAVDEVNNAKSAREAAAATEAAAKAARQLGEVVRGDSVPPPEKGA